MLKNFVRLYLNCHTTLVYKVEPQTDYLICYVVMYCVLYCIIQNLIQVHISSLVVPQNSILKRPVNSQVFGTISSLNHCVKISW